MRGADKCLPDTWMVVRLDGRCFHRFTSEHSFRKPNDTRGLSLMNRCAEDVMREFGNDVVLAYGQSDEFSFVLRPSASLFGRRATKISTSFASLFSSSFVFHWTSFFGGKAEAVPYLGHTEALQLKYAPSFDGRVVQYPSFKTIRDYLSWRQADCHVNNLYNTAFWTLVERGKRHLFKEKLASGTKACGVVVKCGKQNDMGKYASSNASAGDRKNNGDTISGKEEAGTGLQGEDEPKRGAQDLGMSTREAEKVLCGTFSKDKNELLYQHDVNYNDMPQMFRKGSILVRAEILRTQWRTRLGIGANRNKEADKDIDSQTEVAARTGKSVIMALPVKGEACVSTPEDASEVVRNAKLDSADGSRAERRRARKRRRKAEKKELKARKKAAKAAGSDIVTLHIDMIGDSFWTDVVKFCDM